MSALKEFQLAPYIIGPDSGIKARLSEEAWKWFWTHANDTVLSFKVLKIFKVEIKLSDLYSLWKQVFGNDPGVDTSSLPTY